VLETLLQSDNVRFGNKRSQHELSCPAVSHRINPGPVI